MPQVFGADDVGLFSKASLWVEGAMSADEYLRRINAHEDALRDAGFSNDPADFPVHFDTTGFHPRGDVWIKHMGNSNGKKNGAYRSHVVVRVANPDANPDEAETAQGGALPRYAIEMHQTPRDPTKGTRTYRSEPVRTSNPIPFLSKMV